MTKLTFILLLFTLLSCTSSKKESEEANNSSIQSTTSIKRSAYRISSIKDSIVLTGPAPFHFGIQVFREKKKILDYTDKELQINSIDPYGNDSYWFTEHWGQNGKLYIIRAFDGPGPDRFLILTATDSNVVVLGKTEPNSAEIFGDVDFDGKFEIGGINMYCQGGDTTCHSVEYYRVFELAPDFPTDISLTNFFQKGNFLKKN